jgi:gas vesicle protein
VNVDITVAYIAALSALFGSVVGALTSIFIARKQIDSATKALKTEVIRSSLDRLSAFSQELHKETIQLPANASSEQQINILTDLFQKRASRFLSFSYLFPEKKEQEINNLLKSLEAQITKAKTGQPIDPKVAHEILEQMRYSYNEIPILVRQEMRRQTYMIEENLSSKNSR